MNKLKGLQIVFVGVLILTLFLVTGTVSGSEPDLTNGLYSYFSMEDKIDTLNFAVTGESQPISYVAGLKGNALRIETDSNSSMLYLGNSISDQDNTYRDVMYDDATVNAWFNIRSFDSHTNGEMVIISGAPHVQEAEGGCPNGIVHWRLTVTNVPGCSFDACPPNGSDSEALLLAVNSYATDGSHDPATSILITSAEGSLDQDVWHMATFTHDSASNTWRLYLDGTLAADSLPMPEGIGPGALTRACPYAIGNRPLGYNWGMPFSGSIDEIGFWNRVLSDEEISLLFNEGGGLSFEELSTAGKQIIEIDIKPGSDLNCLNGDGQGVIPVAILSSVDFDATQVDPTTVTLDGQAIRIVGKKGNLQSHIEDSNDDGLDDLVVQIEDEDGTYEVGDTIATLMGETFDGIQIQGMDILCIVP